MDKNEAKRILIESISNLKKRRGNITANDVEAEVINNACLCILKNQKEKIQKGNTIEEMFFEAFKSTEDAIPIAKAFTDSAMDLFPQYYAEQNAVMATMGIQQNVAWEGMWDYLRDYFQQNHGIQIDEIETTPLFFYSTEHKRYENDNFVSESKIERTINLNFISDKKELVVSIAPSLSPKKSYLISNNSNEYKYRGSDPDYLFTVTFDDFDEVKNFILEMPNRKLKIIYFE